MNFEEVYGKMFTNIFSPILARFNVPAKEHTYIMKFYLTGIFAIVMEWLDKDCRDDINDIIKIIVDCVMGDRNLGE